MKRLTGPGELFGEAAFFIETPQLEVRVLLPGVGKRWWLWSLGIGLWGYERPTGAAHTKRAICSRTV